MLLLSALAWLVHSFRLLALLLRPFASDGAVVVLVESRAGRRLCVELNPSLYG